MCVVSAIALPRAHATVWQQTIEAPNIYIETLHLDTDEEVIYATNGLSSGTDTVMHLLRITSTGVDQVAYNDNYSGSLRSRIAYTNTASPADFLLVIRAKSESTWGVADLNRFGTLWQPDIPIQGTFLDYAEVDADPDDTLYAVPPPGGSVYPVLLGFADAATDLILTAGLDGAPAGATTLPAWPAVVYLIGTPYLGGSDSGGDPTLIINRDGDARLYVNDCSYWTTTCVNDSDGDGLGDGLEAAIGTCATDPCPYAPTSIDTDRDGLPDGEELFGVADETEPNGSRDLGLPRWGANPRHKDVFVQMASLMDYKGTDGEADPHPFQTPDLPGGATVEEWVAAVRAPYLAGPAHHLRNPDGQDGVEVHLDLGVNPSDPALEAQYGDWNPASPALDRIVEDLYIRYSGPVDGTVTITINGDSESFTADATVDNEGLALLTYLTVELLLDPPLTYDAARSGLQANGSYDAVWVADDQTLHFTRDVTVTGTGAGNVELGELNLRLPHYESPEHVDPVRFHRVRWFLFKPGGGGQTGTWTGTMGPTAGVVRHELGHAVGLSHRGHDQWLIPPGQDLNDRVEPQCLPHYTSLMNYAGSNDPIFGRFTDFEGFFTLNPQSVTEVDTIDLDPDGSLGEDLTYFGDTPWSRWTTATRVDWNLDRVRQNAGTLVSAPIMFANGESCRSFSTGRQDLDTGGPDVLGSVDLVRADNRVYAFWVEESGSSGTGDVVFRHALLGPQSTASCTGPDDPLDYPPSTPQSDSAGCLDWEPTTSLGIDDATSVSAGFFEDLLFVATIRNGAVRTRWYDVSSAGALTQVGSADLGADVQGAPELGVLYARPSDGLGWTERLVLIRGHDGGTPNDPIDDSYHFDRWTGSGFVYDGSANPLEDDSSNVLRGRGDAALVAIPDLYNTSVSLEDRRTCGIFPNQSGTLRLLCYDAGDDEWVDQTDTAWPDAGSNPSNCRAGKAWDAQAGGTGRCLLTSLSQPSIVFRYARLASGAPTNPTLPRGNLQIVRINSQNEPTVLISTEINHPNTTSIRELDRWNDSFRSAWGPLDGVNLSIYEDITMGGTFALTSREGRTEFYPHADGTPNTDFHIGSDFRVMEDRVCGPDSQVVTNCGPVRVNE